MDDLRCRHTDSFDAAKAAFEELCAMVDNLEVSLIPVLSILYRISKRFLTPFFGLHSDY